MLKQVAAYRYDCPTCELRGKVCETQEDALMWCRLGGWKVTKGGLVLCGNCWRREIERKAGNSLAELGGES